MDESKTIWVFTPSRSNPEDLETILVQRHTILQDAVERVKESALTDHKHHLLFVGPRGCGKTHLTTLIVHRLGQDTEVNKKLRIAWLNEDETCTSVLELLLRIHAALEKRYPAEYQEETISKVFDMEPADAQAFLQKQLVGSLEERILLVVAENLDAIFEGLGDKGQKQLRAFIQENPYLTLVATAQRLVDDLSKRTNPFFGFFQTEHLKPLNIAEATKLLQNIAHLRENQEVVDFLATNRGRSRVRALHHLSGGNHRIYIVLSQFITRDSIDALVGPFMKMVDELTPYYQERIRWLPIQQRKIVEYLCICETTVPVKDIAKRLFSTPQTISSQLQSLREKGYVEASQRGRESLYEITEPLMRICVEVKENQTHEPLRLLVNFLRVWYDDSEMNQKLRGLEQGCLASQYLESAIHQNLREGSLRKKIFIEEFEGSPPGKIPEELKKKILEVCPYLPEEFTLAFQSLSEGKKEDVLEHTTHILDNGANGEVKIIATFVRAGCWKEEDKEKAIDDYTSLIDFELAPKDLIIRCLYSRGKLYNDPLMAKADFTKIIEYSEVPKGILIFSILKRAIINFTSESYIEAISDCSLAIEIGDEKVKILAYCLRGIAHQELHNFHESIEDLSQSIQLADSKDITLANALLHRGLAYIAVQSTKAKDDFEKILLLDGVEPDIQIETLFSLANLDIGSARWEDGISRLDEALTISDGENKIILDKKLICLNQIILTLFTTSISPEYKFAILKELFSTCQKHDKLIMLGCGVVGYFVGVYKEGKPFPNSEDLDAWQQALESVAEGKEDFALPLRLIRTGIAFIKQGGTDESILLTLTTPEREILRQALGLSNPVE